MDEIEVISATRVMANTDSSAIREPLDLREAIKSGKAISGYCSFPHARKWAAEVAGGIPHDVWYTERNGDPITLIVPANTPHDALPSAAENYTTFRWIKPEAEFDGPGQVVPVKCRRADS